MKRFPIYPTTIAVCLLFLLSCSRKPTDFRDFLDNEELVYPGKVSGVDILPGKGRLMLKWPASPDPSIVKYVVYWNNRLDSMTVSRDHNSRDSISVLIDNLEEYNYSFQLYSYDVKGNRSVVTEVSNAHSYGNVYQSGLYNRLPRDVQPYIVNGDGSVQLFFATPDTINITTEIEYINAAGVESVAYIGPDESSVTIPSYKSGEPVVFRSYYVPVRNALDTFPVNEVDTFPSIFRLVQADKGLFREYNMWGDMSAYDAGNTTSRLWDGTSGPQGWPNIFHSGGDGVGSTFSFDMGAAYNGLAEVEVTGRDCCHNPTEFEIWGIADITNAIPEMSPRDGNWNNEMLNKGWTLLASVVRGDDGVSARKFQLKSDAPPIRYIRFKVLRNNSGESYVNLSELTFWYKD